MEIDVVVYTYMYIKMNDKDEKGLDWYEITEALKKEGYSSEAVMKAIDLLMEAKDIKNVATPRYSIHVPTKIRLAKEGPE